MYKLPRKAPSKLRFKFLRNYKFPTKTLKCLQLKLSIQLSLINGNRDLDNCVRKFQKITRRAFHRETYFVQFREFVYKIVNKKIFPQSSALIISKIKNVSSELKLQD